MTRWLLLFGLSLSWSLWAAIAQEDSETPAASPAPSPMFSPAASPAPAEAPLPEASPAASPGAAAQPTPPELLPESPVQPTPPPAPPPTRFDLIPPGVLPQLPNPFPQKPSAEQKAKDIVQFRKMRTVAQRDAYSLYLWDRAKVAQSTENEREYLRAYYHYLAALMRKLNPKLESMIAAYENSMIGPVTQTLVRPTIPLRNLWRYQATEKP